MLIDWFTVIAQVVNFLILVWLMKRFLYTPIVNAVDAREQRIAAGLANARVKQDEAQRERDEFKRKNEEFAKERKVLLSAANREAQTERQRLFEEARKAHDDMRSRQMETLRNDFRNLKDEIRHRTGEEVVAIVRKTLADLAAQSLEARMVETFIQRCRVLDEGEKNALQTAFGAAEATALIRSAFPLSEPQQQALELAVREMFAFAGQLKFQTSPDLVSGIALSANGYEVVWSIAEYLFTLEQRIGELLSGQCPADEHKEADLGVAENLR